VRERRDGDRIATRDKRDCTHCHGRLLHLPGWSHVQQTSGVLTTSGESCTADRRWQYLRSACDHRRSAHQEGGWTGGGGRPAVAESSRQGGGLWGRSRPAGGGPGRALPGRGRPQPAAEHDDHGRACVPGQSDPCLWHQGAPPIATPADEVVARKPPGTRTQVQVKTVPRPGWNRAPGDALLAIWPGSTTATRGYPLPRTEVPPPPMAPGQLPASRPAEPDVKAASSVSRSPGPPP
jgi:hypothetical protein